MNLNEYLTAHYRRPFRWGTHDCMTFVNEWVSHVRGSGFYEPSLFPYVSERGAALAYRDYCRHYGFPSFESYFDKIFLRVDYLPPDGSVVARRVSAESATGSRMGILTGRSVAFVTPEGLAMLPYDETTDSGWMV